MRDIRRTRPLQARALPLRWFDTLASTPLWPFLWLAVFYLCALIAIHAMSAS